MRRMIDVSYVVSACLLFSLCPIMWEISQYIG